MRRVGLGLVVVGMACTAANGDFSPQGDSAPLGTATEGETEPGISTAAGSGSGSVDEGGSGGATAGAPTSGESSDSGPDDGTGPAMDTDGVVGWTFVEVGTVAELDAVGFHDDDPSLRSDRLEIYFSSTRPAGPGDETEDEDLYVATRASPDEPWGEPQRLPEPINSDDDDGSPELLHDGLMMTFASARPHAEAHGGLDIYVTTRASLDAPWGPIAHVAGVSDSGVDGSAVMTSDLGRLFFCSVRGGVGNEDLFVADRPGPGVPFGEPVRLGAPINSGYMDCNPWIDEAGQRLLFATSRGGVATDADLAVVEDEGAGFGEVVFLEGVNTSARELDPWLSADGEELYFTRVLPIDDARIVRALRVR